MKKIIGLIGCVTVACMTAFGGLCGDEPGVKSCQQWFKVHATDTKTSVMAESGTYKANKKFKVSSCWFVLSDEGAKVKVAGKRGNGERFEKELACSTFVWNVYGKGLAKKEAKLDSEIYFVAEDEEGTMTVTGSMLGKVKMVKKGSACSETVTYKPLKFKGKFAGYGAGDDCGCYEQLGYGLACQDVTGCGTCGETVTTLRDCLYFEGNDEKNEVFYGNIKMKWSEKKSGCIER